MKIFIDIGAHIGQTIQAVLDPKYQFDKIYSFEPVITLHENLKRIAEKDQRITLFNFGLWNQNCTKNIYSPESLGGSLYADHESVSQADYIKCQFKNASEWFAEHIKNTDEVYVKLNCEGAEIEILLDLCASGEIHKITNVAIDFDSRKIPSLKDKDQLILQNFTQIGFTNFSLVEHIMRGPTHLVRIQSWLDQTSAIKKSFYTSVKQLGYVTKSVIRNKRPGFSWELKHWIKKYLPTPLLTMLNARKS